MRKYDSVERLGKEECEGILNGTVYVFEKIDGANVSLYWDNEKGLVICSRNTEVYTDKNGGNFRGIAEYVNQNPRIRIMVSNERQYIFYGEWLVKHTIMYPPENANNIWFFDIFHKDGNQYLPYGIAQNIWENYVVKYIKVREILENPHPQDLTKHLHINYFEGYPEQEGIVIKNYEFRNIFGRTQWAKIVNEQFKEITKVKKEKSSNVLEEELALKFITSARVEKIYNKIKEDNVLSEKDTPRILSTVFNDFIQEEMWDIIRNYKCPTINFKVLRKEAEILIKKYYFNLLQK